MRIVGSRESSAAGDHIDKHGRGEKGGKRTVVVFPQCLLEIGEVAVLVCAAEGAHTVNLTQLGIPSRRLHRK